MALFAEFITDASLASENARHLAARIFAPYDGYFYSLGATSSRASDQLVVIDLGPSTLAKYQSAWPLPYGHHARMLERVRLAKPKALFIDFQFQAQREDPSLQDLLNTLCAFHDDGIPVYLASGNEVSAGRLRPELEALRNSKQQQCFEKVGVAHKPSEIDRISWTYPLFVTVGEQTLPSAGLALARTLRGAELVGKDTENTTMGLTWGYSDQENGPSWTSQAGAQDKADAHYCKGQSWRDLVPLQRLFSWMGFEPDARPNCPMHASIEAGWLTAPKTVDQAEALAARIQGHAVLYGGSFDANDFVTSPLQGDLPGVYLHAQAADNLVRHGEDWRRTDLSWRWHHPLGEYALTFVYLLALSIVFSSLRWIVSVLGKPLTAWLGKPSSRVQATVLQAPAVILATPSLKSANRSIPVWLKDFGAKAIALVLGKALGIVKFFAVLPLVLPLCLGLEKFGSVSVIGYSSLLAFCLLGDLFEAHEKDRRCH